MKKTTQLTFTTRRVLLLLIVIGSIFHFFNINWGAPFYFHPDERNIASSVTQLQYTETMHPHFFAYGSLPIYAIYFIGYAWNALSEGAKTQISHVQFSHAIIISRILSALFATALIPLLYTIGKKLRNAKTGIFAATLMTFSPGIIQFAHFGTFEMWITFFSTLLFWTCLKIVEYKTLRFFVYASFILGILFSIKVTTIVLSPLPFIAYGVHLLQKEHFIKKTLRIFSLFLIAVCITSIIYTATNPYVFRDTHAFIASMNYETSVGMNTLPVFYTQEFYDTIPVLYQITHIFPFLINPLMTLVGLSAIIYFLFIFIKQRKMNHFLLLCFFFILFLPQAFLFIKWTRNMVPTLPFLFLIIALAFSYAKKEYVSLRRTIWIALFLSINILFALSYFITAFLMPDTRLAAYAYAAKILPENASILSEMYDLGIIPYNAQYKNITLFNTYDLDASSNEFNKKTWETAAAAAEYVILPSQRVLQTRMQNKHRFPIGNKIYTDLIEGNNSFQKIYETPCNIFCKITYFGDPAYRYEQTASVFERPTVMIFKKKL